MVVEVNEDLESAERYRKSAFIAEKVIKGFEYDDPTKTSFSLLDIEIMLQSEFGAQGEKFIPMFEPLFEECDTVEMKEIKGFARFLTVYNSALVDRDFQKQLN